MSVALHCKWLFFSLISSIIYDQEFVLAITKFESSTYFGKKDQNLEKQFSCWRYCAFPVNINMWFYCYLLLRALYVAIFYNLGHKYS